jgi:hypothetical protein
MHNYVRSLDLFTMDHYEDPRPDIESDEEEDEWSESDSEQDEKGRTKHRRKKKRGFVTLIKLSGAGVQEVNGIYERVVGSEKEAGSDGVAHFVKSFARTKLYTTAATDGELVIKRYTINGER